MSRNFLDNSAWMVGVDLHTYLALVPPSPAPVPVPFHPTAVACRFAHFSNGERCSTVTADGQRMIKSTFDLDGVPHLSVPVPPPHLAELANLLFIVATSGSAPSLYTPTVTGEGTPLSACSLAESIAMNINCGQMINVVICVSTVKTEPSAADYAKAATRIGWSMVKDAGFGALPNTSIPILGDVLGYLLQKAFEPLDNIVKSMLGI